MWRVAILGALSGSLLAQAGAALPAPAPCAVLPAPNRVSAYRIERAEPRQPKLAERFTAGQLEILEKLNRADLNRLPRLRELVVPETWAPDERAYSPLPALYPSSGTTAKLLVVHLPGQVFAAYEFGVLVRWGPVNSGARDSQTPAGLFSLNWRSTGHYSSVDPEWYLPWYFNFESRQGLAFHEYSLPGLPVSHGCIRMLSRDAQWLYRWGDPWTGAGGRTPGTPLLILGPYHFGAPPPWRSLEWLASPVDLPIYPKAETTSNAGRPQESATYR